ncbi:MAG: GntR family transcriptional regulator [Desulfobacter sp.]|nr:MAG: GntR family transcriptional regulator [Desulfobacter sp.]
MAEQKNLTLKVYNNIKQMMLNYDIVPGQRLVFVDLAKELGVSRTPVNNALSILAKEGYLDFIPNQGYSVHKLTQEEAEALYEIRLILDLGIIEKAIKLSTPEGLRHIELRKNEYASSVKSRIYRHIFLLDMNFHSAIAEMAQNIYFKDIYTDIYQRIFLRFRTEHLESKRLFEIVDEHEGLYNAIKAKDTRKARKLVKEHSAMSKKNLFPIIFNQNPSDLS